MVSVAGRMLSLPSNGLDLYFTLFMHSFFSVAGPAVFIYLSKYRGETRTGSNLYHPSKRSTPSTSSINIFKYSISLIQNSLLSWQQYDSERRYPPKTACHFPRPIVFSLPHRNFPFCGPNNRSGIACF